MTNVRTEGKIVKLQFQFYPLGPKTVKSVECLFQVISLELKVRRLHMFIGTIIKHYIRPFHSFANIHTYI